MAKLQVVKRFLEGENFNVTITEECSKYARYEETVLIAKKDNIEIRVNKGIKSKFHEEAVLHNGIGIELTMSEYYDLIGYYMIESQRDLITVIKAKLEKLITINIK